MNTLEIAQEIWGQDHVWPASELKNLYDFAHLLREENTKYTIDNVVNFLNIMDESVEGRHNHYGHAARMIANEFKP
jgi:hypothetical protein